MTVKITNLTEVQATFAYFTVIHYTGIETSNDYGFVLLEPGQSQTVTYSVSSTILDRKVDLPFFAALYVPSNLNGSKSLKLEFEF